jgi:hypothetical protein
LARQTDKAKPEVVDLRTLSFCNQTSILDYPFAIRHLFSPAELRKANSKWGKDEYGATCDIETLITLTKKENKKEIEVFEVHGLMPADWLEKTENFDEEEKDIQQIQVVAFYKKEEIL